MTLQDSPVSNFFLLENLREDPTCSKVEGGMRGVPPHSYYAPRPQPRQKIPASDCDMNLGCTNNSLHFRKNYKHENHFHLQYPVIEMDN